MRFYLKHNTDCISSEIISQFKNAERREIDKLIKRFSVNGEYCFMLSLGNWEPSVESGLDIFEMEDEEIELHWKEDVRKTDPMVTMLHPKKKVGINAYVLSATNDIDDDVIYLEVVDSDMHTIGNQEWWPSEFLFAGELHKLSQRMRKNCTQKSA